MSYILQVKSPVDNSIYAERLFATDIDIKNALVNGVKAQASWKNTSLTDREKICRRAVECLLAVSDEVSNEITWQMGRPIRYTPGELKGFAERANYMIDIAANKLSDIKFTDQEGFNRFIERVPVGLVFSIVPWNYPFLTAVNSVVPAIMAGNAVIVKPSSQTPLTAERIGEAFKSAGLPDGVYQQLLLSHEATNRIIQASEVNYVSFTGSVSGGRMVEQAAAGRFIDVGLELGGKDPAYVCPDADLPFTVNNLVDGAYFNSGQSCCGIERIYVHESVFGDFVDGFIDLVEQYHLGNPTDPETTLGPMVRTRAAELVRNHIEDAVDKGAKACIDPSIFLTDQPGSPYLAPQVLTNVDHNMSVMTQETFGPVVGIMKVKSDEDAVALMNDSEFGLTASLWTKDEERALSLGEKINTGTCFMNRCDYLDPALAWTGTRHSGKGCTLSEIGYEKLTRPKSFHLRKHI